MLGTYGWQYNRIKNHCMRTQLWMLLLDEMGRYRVSHIIIITLCISLKGHVVVPPADILKSLFLKDQVEANVLCSNLWQWMMVIAMNALYVEPLIAYGFAWSVGILVVGDTRMHTLMIITWRPSTAMHWKSRHSMFGIMLGMGKTSILYVLGY